MRLSPHETTSNTDGKARESGIELGKTAPLLRKGMSRNKNYRQINEYGRYGQHDIADSREADDPCDRGPDSSSGVSDSARKGNK